MPLITFYTVTLFVLSSILAFIHAQPSIPPVNLTSHAPPPSSSPKTKSLGVGRVQQPSRVDSTEHKEQEWQPATVDSTDQEFQPSTVKSNQDISTVNSTKQTSTTTPTEQKPTAIPSSGLDQQLSQNLQPGPENGDHPEWRYQNGVYIRDQQDHFRFHCYLAMSYYGDYEHKCPKTFTGGFVVLSKFPGGYIAQVEEMRKVVIVFGGVRNYAEVDLTPVTVSDMMPRCTNCLVANGVKQRYLTMKAATQGFAIAKQAIYNSTLTNPTDPLKFSTTGLGWGGALATLCGMDLGYTNDVHFVHNSGMPRFMNWDSVVAFDNLFQFLAAQSVVHANDYAVQLVPRGIFEHPGQKVNIFGDRTQWYVNCFGNNENTTCLGDGSSQQDHYYYFTPMGECGSADKGF